MIYIEEHIKRYPKMELQDKIKLIYQGSLGPNHLNVNKEKLLLNLENEYNLAINKNFNYDMIEEISDSYVRIYIKPYFDAYKSFTKLIEAFTLSCKEETDYKIFLENINIYLKNENTDIVSSFINKTYIHHSDSYKENYKPYYLVIHKKYINIIKGE